MRRRDFMFVSGGAIAGAILPCPGSAQTANSPKDATSPKDPAWPRVGFVSSSNTSKQSAANLLKAFREGLAEGGYTEDHNLTIEYRWGGGQIEHLPHLFADLVTQQVDLIVASGGLASAVAARASTESIPILFVAGFDPVRLGFVKSLSHPGGNATGVSTNTIELADKRLDLLHRLVPKAKIVGLLVNPAAPEGPKIEIERTTEAAHKRGLKLQVLEAATDRDFEPAFASLVQQPIDGLLVNANPFFTPRRAQIVALAARHRLPTVYPWPEYVEAGGLISYGPTLAWAYLELGRYAHRILKGAKPSDLPVQQPTKFVQLLNVRTAKSLGLTVPRIVLAGTDEFLE
jgi:putative tryptophan/tyrosine transport system substrate-binding protein